MKKEMSKVYDPKDVESRIYAWWQEKDYFKPEVHQGGKSFTIVMPPPNITGKQIGRASCRERVCLYV